MVVLGDNVSSLPVHVGTKSQQQLGRFLEFNVKVM